MGFVFRVGLGFCFLGLFKVQGVFNIFLFSGPRILVVQGYEGFGFVWFVVFGV